MKASPRKGRGLLVFVRLFATNAPSVALACPREFPATVSDTRDLRHIDLSARLIEGLTSTFSARSYGANGPRAAARRMDLASFSLDRPLQGRTSSRELLARSTPAPRTQWLFERLLFGRAVGDPLRDRLDVLFGNAGAEFTGDAIEGHLRHFCTLALQHLDESAPVGISGIDERQVLTFRNMSEQPQMEPRVDRRDSRRGMPVRRRSPLRNSRIEGSWISTTKEMEPARSEPVGAAVQRTAEFSIRSAAIGVRRWRSTARSFGCRARPRKYPCPYTLWASARLAGNRLGAP